MKRMTAMMSAAAVVLTTTMAFAQAKPNFAGTWTRADAPGAAAPAGGQGGGRGGGGRGGFGMEVAITQDANTITMKWMQGGGQGTPTEQTRTYKLDGTESKNSVMGRGGQPADQVSKAAWEGSKLVISTTTQAGETKQTLSMTGADLTVEQSGGQGRDGAPNPTTTVTYKKKA